MRAELHEWYVLSPSERDDAVRTGLIAFDASSLLTLYRMSKQDRERVLDLLSAVGDRVWVSHRAAFEFQRNRLAVYYEQLDAYSSLKKEFDALRSKIRNAKAHPVLSQDDIRTEITDRLTQLEKYITDTQSVRHTEDLTNPLEGDGVRDSLDAIFAGRIGAPTELTTDTLTEARRRLKSKIPPGYEDHKKPEPDCFGDYFVWSETLRHMEARPGGPGPLLFVTEEQKADWWLFAPRGRQIVGPRPELVLEAATRGVRPFLMLSLGRFYQAQVSALGWDVEPLGGYASAGLVQDGEVEGEPAESMPIDEG